MEATWHRWSFDENNLTLRQTKSFFALLTKEFVQQKEKQSEHFVMKQRNSTTQMSEKREIAEFCFKQSYQTNQFRIHQAKELI